MTGQVRLAVTRVDTVPRRYLWVKSVRAVDLQKHCAQSLVGAYLTRVDRRAWAQELVLPPAGVGGTAAWYFCGVTGDWSQNDHALLLPDPGGVDRLATPGYDLVVQGARFQAFDVDSVPRDTRNADDPRFATCRNWQAAHWLHRFADLPDGRSSRTS